MGCGCSSGAGGHLRNTRGVDLTPRAGEQTVTIIKRPDRPQKIPLTSRSIVVWTKGSRFVVSDADVAVLRAGGWIA